MHQSAFLCSEMKRIHLNVSQSSSIYPQISSPSLYCDFLKNSTFPNFQLSFSSKYQMENHQFPKWKIWKICKKFIWMKNCLGWVWGCFSANFLVFGCVRRYCLLFKSHKACTCIQRRYCDQNVKYPLNPAPKSNVK